MIKKVISYLYHKYVCKPPDISDIDKEDFLKICEEFYELDKLNEPKTFEENDKIFREAFWKIYNGKSLQLFFDRNRQPEYNNNNKKNKRNLYIVK